MSWLDKIKSFFIPSADNCTKEEEAEDKKHEEYVSKEEERYRLAKEKLKTTKNCKIKYPESSVAVEERKIENASQPILPPKEKEENDNQPILQPKEENNNQFAFNFKKEEEQPIRQDGGKRKKSKRNRKSKRKNTKRNR